MSDVTIKQLAGVLGMGVDKLITQLAEAGMKFSGPDQVVSSTEKVKLLGFLRRTHGKTEKEAAEDNAPRQVTLKRRTVSELTVNQGAARGKTVNVEVRQKRTYVKRSTMADGQEVDSEREDALRKLQESQLKRESEESARQEQERRRQEEEAKLRAAEEAKRPAEEARQRAEAEAKPAVAAVRCKARRQAEKRRAAAAPRKAATEARPANHAAVMPRRPTDSRIVTPAKHGSHRCGGRW